MSEPDFSAKLEEIKNSLKGLSMEVEGWRQHTGSTGEFILVALKDMLNAVNKLQKAIE